MTLDESRDKAIDDLMEIAGFTKTDGRIILEISEHACKEAMERLVAVLDTLPHHLVPATTLVALTRLGHMQETGIKLAARAMSRQQQGRNYGDVVDDPD